MTHLNRALGNWQVENIQAQYDGLEEQIRVRKEAVLEALSFQLNELDEEIRLSKSLQSG